MRTTREQTEYMRNYRVRYGITKSVVVPVGVLGRILEGEDRQAIRPLTDFLGQQLASSVREACDYERKCNS